MNPTQTPPASGRSLARAASLEHGGRRRRYGLRWIVVAALCLLLAAFLYAVATRAFDPDGPGRTIYALHDSAYLWLRGEIWVRLFPYALLWLVPLALFVALVSVELLTPLGPIRSLHRRAVLACASRPWAARVFARPFVGQQIDPDVWTASLGQVAGPVRRVFGFARRVVLQVQEEAWFTAATRLPDPRPEVAPPQAAIVRLVRLMRLRLRLDPSDARAHLRAFEIAAAWPGERAVQDMVASLQAFYGAQENPDLVKPLSVGLDAMARISPQVRATCHGELRLQINRIQQALAAPNAVADDAETLIGTACCMVRAAHAARTGHLPDGAVFQRLWTEARLVPEPADLARLFHRAEALIYHEMWAKLAEYPRVRQQGADLVDQAFGPAPRRSAALSEQPEVFAWEGRLS